MMQVIKYPNKSDWNNLLKRPTIDSIELEEKVSTILKNVKEKGDTALREYALLFDKTELSDIQVSEKEINDASTLVSEELKEAIQTAKRNIEKFLFISTAVLAAFLVTISLLHLLKR